MIQYVLDPQNRFYAMKDEVEELVGFCSFGEDGQVPGGDYHLDALDIGMGIRPDLTGRGLGINYVNSVLEFARGTFNPCRFRVTIAAFNQRAMRVWQKAGFRQESGFRHVESRREFVVMVSKNSYFNE